MLDTGVDEFYNVKAGNEKRDIQYLEAAADQLEFIAQMGQGREDEFITYMLDDLKELPNTFQSLKDAWRNGNNEKMEDIAIDPWKDRFPKIFKSLVVDRNNNWIQQIEAMMETKEVELILFGALHLVGEEGVLSLLKKRGYAIENL